MSRRPAAPQPLGFRRGKRVADLMTPELIAFNDRAIAAERVGDASEALEYHLGIPMFRRSRHRSMLEQLVAASEELTPWAWARWVVYQALRAEDAGTETGARLRQAVHDAGESFHADLMDTAYDEGGDPVKVVARVLGESWASHQLAAYDYGVLPAFLDELAGEELREKAALAQAWVGAAMGGYRVEGRAGPGALSVRDLESDGEIEVLDLGAAGLTGPEGCLIGRLVPSGTTPELMFDMAPLPVDEITARHVASATGDGWADVLMVGIESGRLDGGDLLREDYELMTDVLGLSLLEFATKPSDLAWVRSQLEEGRDEFGRAAFRILREASTGGLEEVAAPYVSAAVLNPHGYTEARRTIVASGQREHWTRWAELTSAPASGRLQAFADVTGGDA